ncbi:MAG: hypothetical protein M3O46_12090 [Myxococcota bacterium]|nr:hypothetical protein [Myxococcota bacterium]
MSHAIKLAPPPFARSCRALVVLALSAGGGIGCWSRLAPAARTLEKEGGGGNKELVEVSWTNEHDPYTLVHGTRVMADVGELDFCHFQLEWRVPIGDADFVHRSTP